MKTAILAALFMMTANAFALTIPNAEQKKLDSRIASHIRAQTGFGSLDQYRVDWNSLKCISTPNEMTETEMGICTVPASAFQVQAQAAIIVTESGYRVSLVFVNVE